MVNGFRIFFRVSIGSLLIAVSLAFAQSSMTKPLPLQVYEKVWSETNSETRLELIKTIWLEESTYEDPSISIKGPIAFNAMVDGFYKSFPEATLVGNPLLTKDNFYTWSWTIFDGKQKQMLTGRDFVELNGKGQILKVIGFFEQPNAGDKNVQIVAKYFECLFKTRDFKTMSEIIATGAVYDQAEGLPYGGTFVGFENWMKMFTQASSLFDLQIEKEPTYFTAAVEDGVVIQFTIKCISKKTGNVISMPIAEHFEVKDEKITSIRPFYFDTKRFADFLK